MEESLALLIVGGVLSFMGVMMNAIPVKFLARNDEDAQLYIKKVGATSWMKPDTLNKVGV